MMDLKAESDLIVVRGRIETYRRDAVSLMQRAVRLLERARKPGRAAP